MLLLGMPGNKLFKSPLVPASFRHPAPQHPPLSPVLSSLQERFVKFRWPGCLPCPCSQSQISTPRFSLALAPAPSSGAWRAHMGHASSWRPPEPGARQGSSIVGAKRWDVPGDRRDRRDGAGTSPRITIMAVGRMRNLTSQSPGSQSPEQHPRKARGKAGGCGSKVVTRCVTPGWP